MIAKNSEVINKHTSSTLGGDCHSIELAVSLVAIFISFSMSILFSFVPLLVVHRHFAKAVIELATTPDIIPK